MTVKDWTRNFLKKPTLVEHYVKWGQQEIDLNLKFLETKEKVHSALCGNWFCEVCFFFYLFFLQIILILEQVWNL